MSNTNQNTDGLMLLVEAVNLIEAQDEGDREASSLKTEDTGLTLEKAVCLALGINYNGKTRRLCISKCHHWKIWSLLFHDFTSLYIYT